MKKSIFFAFLLMLMISVLGYLIYDSKIQRDNFTIINKKVKNITLLNMEFDLYIQNPLSYDNFDIIQRKITQFKNDLDEIRSNHILHKIKNQDLTQRLYILKKTTQEKFELMEKVKAHRAILNNSFRLIQKLYQFDLSPQFNSLYSTLLTTQLNPEIDLNQTLKKTLDLVSSNKYEKNFLKHAKIVLQYQLKFQKITLLLEKLHSKEKLDHFVTNYQKLTQDKIQRAYLSTIVLFGLLVLMITLNLVFAYRLIQSNKKLSRFRKTVENSDNIVVITNNHETITYVNDAFTRTTGYTYEEAIGQKPSILKSGKQSDLFY
ncbi:MAG: PAS domain S-box protein, partial [Campylobacterota bacterium]|nr:PAS domain S-box protein [Campylobacterota bacterium]